MTDRAFYDIGLPGNDLGRGPIIGVAGANHAFKTPGPRPAGAGEDVSIKFQEPGRFEVFCGIHPSMRLGVEVEAAQ